MSITTITEWLQGLPIPWLVGETNGQADVTSYGTVLDGQVTYLREATKARMPDEAPSDALGPIGKDRGLIQGAGESNDNFRTRLRTAWDDWSRAGTALELLVQLYWNDFPDAVVIQQNGLAYSLSAAPTAGSDPTSLLDITTLGALGTALTSSVHPEISVPAGTPWWTFDDDVEFCSRFAILFPSTTLIAITGTATFTGFEDGSDANPWPTVVWNNTFANTSYHILAGPPIITDGSGPVEISVPGSSITRTTCQVDSTAPFAGSVNLIAWATGFGPFGSISTARLALLRSLINQWRPAKSTCVLIYVFTEGQLWGWPITTWGATDLEWSDNTIIHTYTP